MNRIRTRTRRVAAVAALTSAALVGGLAVAPVADAAPEPEVTSMQMQARSTWACIAVRGVNVGFCLDNPLPRFGR